jgi:hypothetical protein
MLNRFVRPVLTPRASGHRVVYRPPMPQRWEGDDRGRGIGEAVQLVEGAKELITSFTQPGWVTEQPELHLRPHVEEWCRQDGRLALTDAHNNDSNAYILDVQWLGESLGVGEARAAVFCLIGSFAESATYVRQRRISGDARESAQTLQFEVGTGELAPDARFDPHGHVVMINLRGVI